MGRPVVATTGGALPEVVSGRSIAIAPRDGAAISSAVQHVATSDVSAGPVHCFRWDTATEQHLDIYAQLAARHFEPPTSNADAH